MTANLYVLTSALAFVMGVAAGWLGWGRTAHAQERAIDELLTELEYEGLGDMAEEILNRYRV